MRIREDLLAVEETSRPGQVLPALTGIVVHWVANPGATPSLVRDYFASVSRYASCHYIIGIDGEVLRIIPDDEVAYHAGPSDLTKEATRRRLGGLPNWRTIGIEVCHSDWEGRFSDKAMEALISLTARIVRKAGIDVRNILRHYDCTGKDCPAWYVEHPEEWARFKGDVVMATTPRNVMRG